MLAATVEIGHGIAENAGKGRGCLRATCFVLNVLVYGAGAQLASRIDNCNTGPVLEPVTARGRSDVE